MKGLESLLYECCLKDYDILGHVIHDYVGMLNQEDKAKLEDFLIHNFGERNETRH